MEVATQALGTAHTGVWDPGQPGTRPRVAVIEGVRLEQAKPWELLGGAQGGRCRSGSTGRLDVCF